MNKMCNKCGVEKPLEEFSVGRSCCRLCRNEQKRIYRKNNKEVIAEYNCAYRSSHKKEIARFNRAYYLANKNEIRKQKRKYGYVYQTTYAPYDTYAQQLDFAEIVFKGINGVLLVRCTYCGKFYIPNIRAVRARILAINGKCGGEARLYCSGACKRACPSYNQNKYWKSQKIATSREVSAQFRQLVLKRDNWICQRCGAGIEAELHVHHIEGATQQPGISNDLENGITLCKTCHKHVHSQNGCRYYELRCPKINKGA